MKVEGEEDYFGNLSSKIYNWLWELFKKDVRVSVLTPVEPLPNFKKSNKIIEWATEYFKCENNEEIQED